MFAPGGVDLCLWQVKAELLVQMDGVGSVSAEDEDGPAQPRQVWVRSLRKMRMARHSHARRIYIPLPEPEGRNQLFEINLKEVKLGADVAVKGLVDKTKGYSGPWPSVFGAEEKRLEAPYASEWPATIRIETAAQDSQVVTSSYGDPSFSSAALRKLVCDTRSGGSDSGLQACDVDALMHETHGFGHLFAKPVMSFLGVSELGRALSHDGLSTDLKRSKRASVFLGGVGSFSKWRLACNDAATSQGADVTNVCREAAMMGLRRRMQQARKVDVPVTQADFLEAISNVNRSVVTVSALSLSCSSSALWEGDSSDTSSGQAMAGAGRLLLLVAAAVALVAPYRAFVQGGIQAEKMSRKLEHVDG
ncbi:Katanin p60 ATPase-containing subunit A1 [Symbiodinium microadriaticum]|uniref:Katanin p60 ATPase-containing subunit A1 n=1 Tax=Symbiodinium microadriaticum TaxID=2951 RepID=A0A1Q9DW45_SYMMI|nr:Katanin p60 ATPase-containing subunit A1 [Symbiodinium microadriaticum]